MTVSTFTRLRTQVASVVAGAAILAFAATPALAHRQSVADEHDSDAIDVVQPDTSSPDESTPELQDGVENDQSGPDDEDAVENHHPDGGQPTG